MVTIETIRAQVRKGIAAIARGDHTDYRRDQAREEMFRDIKREGRQRLAAGPSDALTKNC